MKVVYEEERDMLAIFTPYNGEGRRSYKERCYGPAVMLLIDEATGEQFGWTVYGFSGAFTEGRLDDSDGLLPKVEDLFETAQAPGDVFLFEQFLQWAYDNLVKAPAQ